MRIPTPARMVLVAALALGLRAPAAAAETIRVERVPPGGVTRPLGDWRAPSEPPWGLALGGGGAWGLAHLGFLEAMEEDGVRPPRLAGTSAGALAGAVYAAGIPTREIAEIFRAAERDPGRSGADGADRLGRAVRPDPLSPVEAPVRFGPGEDGRPLPWRGLFPEDRLAGELARHFARPDADAGGDLDRLRVPFRAVSADLAANEPYAPRFGSLPLLVRASISLPLLPPVRLGDRVLVDGGAFEEVPVPTLRALGASPVIGVRLTDDGDDFDGLPDKFGFRALDALYNDRIVAAHRREVLESADLRVDLRVGDASPARFLGQLDDLLVAGRAAWVEQRERVLRTIEGSAPGTVRIARVEAADPRHREDAAEIAARLGASEGPVERSRFRVEIELVRLLRSGLGEDARLVVGDDGVAVLHVDPRAPVRSTIVDFPESLAPWLSDLDLDGHAGPREAVAAVEAGILAARRDGRFLAGLASVRFDAATGTLEIAADDGTVRGVDLRTLGAGPDGDLRETPAGLEALVAAPADLDDLAAEIDRLERRDLLQGARIVGVRRDSGYRVDLEAESPPRRRTALAFGLGDAFVPTVGWALSVPRPAPSSWTWEARILAGREGVLAGLEAAVSRERGFEPFVRAAGGRPVLPLYDARGGSDGRRSLSSAGLAAGVRVRDGRAGSLEVGGSARWASASSFLTSDEALEGTDGAVEAAWTGALGAPTRGLDWSVEASLPFAGRERAASAALDVGGRVGLGDRGRWGVGVLARAAWTDPDRALPLDRWPEVGAWWEAPGLSPGRSRARAVTRGTVIVRRALAPLGPLPLAIGASAATWRVDEIRVDPALPDRGTGAALFVQAGLPRGGALTLGWSGADFDGDRFFVLLDPTRAAWPGVRLRLPGR